MDEPPAAPVAPTVVSGEDQDNGDPDESTTTLKVIWHEPENTGPSITGYDVEYKKITDTSFSEWTHNIAGYNRHDRPLPGRDLEADTLLPGAGAGEEYREA